MNVTTRISIMLIGCTFFCWGIQSAFAQTVSEIKGGKEFYWGEGIGKTSANAEKEALSMLINQISVTVENKFSLLSEQLTDNNKAKFTQKVNDVVNTYSNATLKNTEKMEWEEKDVVHILCYIKRSEVSKIFAEREGKIKDFIATAIKAEENLQIADALKYYYWALLLLQSHPDGNTITYAHNGAEPKLAVFLPQQINAVFAKLDFRVIGKQTEPNITLYNLAILYNKQPVSNCEYSVYDGRNWSPLSAAKDGKGVAELLGEDATLHKKISVRVEYEFGDEWKTDKEVNDILSKVEGVPFKKAKIDVAMNKVPDFKAVDDSEPIDTKPIDTDVAVATANKSAPTTNTSVEVDAKSATATNTSATVAAPAKNVLKVDGTGYLPLLKRVETAISTKNYESARECFTAEGYTVFQKLIQYGKAVIIAKPDYVFMQFDDGVLARSLSMRFSFSNRRTFVENVVFDIDMAAGKIRSLSFALTDKACKDIISHDKWTEYSRVSIINFIENYQTAYALKRLDYLQSIFSDNALIITGKVLRTVTAVENQYQQAPKIQFNRQSKSQYMRNLQKCFQNNEYVNLKFTDVSIKKGAKGGEIYGIQMQQDYFSSSYGDTGYLFVLVDVNKPNEPIIHVRAWQPEKDPDFGLYDIYHF
ncbi:hypothetical protein FACS1894199_06710 [Bacteroidia bacterium]|nr:hypothetical protein FACS1894199_06710 [Bacteroidia bacterium]